MFQLPLRTKFRSWLGSEAFTDDYVKESLLGITDGVMSKLMDFEDTQAALFLLRLSFGIVRATHFMRTTPSSLWSKQAEEFDKKVCHTVFQCLSLKPTPEAYEQVSVSTTIGGLGIRRIVDHARGAFTASWFEGQGVTVAPPPDPSIALDSLLHISSALNLCKNLPSALFFITLPLSIMRSQPTV